MKEEHLLFAVCAHLIPPNASLYSLGSIRGIGVPYREGEPRIWKEVSELFYINILHIGVTLRSQVICAEHLCVFMKLF